MPPKKKEAPAPAPRPEPELEGKAKWQAERLAKNDENKEAQDAFVPDKNEDGTLKVKDRK
jgi:hypothetical protein